MPIRPYCSLIQWFVQHVSASFTHSQSIWSYAHVAHASSSCFFALKASCHLIYRDTPQCLKVVAFADLCFNYSDFLLEHIPSQPKFLEFVPLIIDCSSVCMCIQEYVTHYWKTSKSNSNVQINERCDWSGIIKASKSNSCLLLFACCSCVHSHIMCTVFKHQIKFNSKL